MITSNYYEVARVYILRERFLSDVVSCFLPLFFMTKAMLWLGLAKVLVPFVGACIGVLPFAFYRRGGRSGATRKCAPGCRKKGKALVRGLYLDAPSYEDASTRQREVSASVVYVRGNE